GIAARRWWCIAMPASAARPPAPLPPPACSIRTATRSRSRGRSAPPRRSRRRTGWSSASPTRRSDARAACCARSTKSVRAICWSKAVHSASISTDHGHRRMSEKPLTPIEIGLTAAIVAIDANEPLVLIAQGVDGGRDGDMPAGESLAGLPFGPFDAVAHRTFEIGLRAWVEQQAGLRLGYVEQLYTFGDRGRHTRPGDTE